MRPAVGGDKHLPGQIKLTGASFDLLLFPHQTKSEDGTFIQQLTKDFPEVLERLVLSLLHALPAPLTLCAVQKVQQKQKDLDSFDLNALRLYVRGSGVSLTGPSRQQPASISLSHNCSKHQTTPCKTLYSNRYLQGLTNINHISMF